jgi:hypothetical protein
VSANAISFNVAAVNDAPTGTNKTVSLNEDSSYTFSTADFGYADNDGNSMASIKITSLPGAGALKLSGTAVTVNQVIPAASIPSLTFTPVANANGTAYANFNFTVNDGTLDSVSANAISFNVAAVNDAPTGTNKTVSLNEDSSYTFSTADFGYADNDGNSMASIKITSLPGAGALKLSGTAVTVNQVIPAASIPSLTFTPVANANGTAYANFNFTVNDGTLDSVSANAISFNVAAVNDAPTLTAFASTIASGNEDSAITVTFANLQSQGNEADDGTVTAFVVKAVSSGTLKIGLSAATATAWNATSNNTIDASHQAYWTPAANANGTLNGFTAVAKDDGGLLSATPVQATVNVAAVPDVNVTSGVTPVEGGTTGTFTVSLDSPAPVGGLTVNYTLAGTAALSTDYTVTAGSNVAAVTGSSFTIAAGQTSATLNVNAVSDAVSDPSETVKLSLTAGVGYQLASSSLSAFAPAIDYTTGIAAPFVGAGDFNNDGRLDLVVSNDNSVSVLLRNATNTDFDAGVPYPAGSIPESITVGDFNNDGKLDLATANWNINTVSVLMRNAANTGFDTNVDYTAGTTPDYVATADLITM